MEENNKHPRGADPASAGLNHERQLPRLNRIEGQVRGLQKMVEEGRDCLDIVHQTSAIISALRRVQSDMLHDHLSALAEAIFSENVSPNDRRKLANEISEHLRRLP